jgi:uncharacterized protein YkwD
MLNPTHKNTNKNHIFISILIIAVIIPLILLPIFATPIKKDSLIKSPTEFTKSVNVDKFEMTTSSTSASSSSAIIVSSSLTISSILETPKPDTKPIEQPKNDSSKEIDQIPAQKIETQNNLEIVPEIPKPPVVAPPQPKVVELIKPIVEVAIAPKIVEQPAPKSQPVVEQPKIVTSDLFSTSGCDSNLASQMLTLVNNHRAQNNANPLSLSSQLDGIACAHSKWMTQTGTFSHTGRDGTSPFERCQKAGTFCYAENVAYNTIPNVQDLFDQFKTSPGHNLNMLDPNFVEVGLAFDGIYVTQVFR